MNNKETSINIILIEKDQATADLYFRILNEQYHVFLCENDDQVLESARLNKISAIIIEPFLNTGKSWKFLSSVIQIATDNGEIPVIVCSSLDARKRGIDMGAKEFLVKPVLPSTLISVLQKEITRSKSSISKGAIND